MINNLKLSLYKKELTHLIGKIQENFNVETAVFDAQGGLVACSETYGLYKGFQVHLPSINEVLEKGHLVVNHPGHMASCKGCRFSDRCPSKIELLTPIYFNQYAVGVITLTSFSDKGHEEIKDNLNTYINFIRYLSNTIAGLLFKNKIKDQSLTLYSTLLATMEACDQSLMIIDTFGQITEANKLCHHLFGQSNMRHKHLKDFLPDDQVQAILSADFSTTRTLPLGKCHYKVVYQPILLSGTKDGFLVKILSRPDLYKPSLGPAPKKLHFEDMIGQSDPIKNLLKAAKKVAPSKATLLIQGETGTGKGLLAEIIHGESPRKNGPFVYVNCGAIPDTLIESELFGYEEGAFTGAKKGGHMGKIEKAHQGTLFLDEIGEMPLSMQVKLLRFLQSQKIERIGSNKTLQIDTRVITATHQDLALCIKNKSFRADLFYRISVIPLKIPPLKDRKEDILLLAHYFLKTHAKEHLRNITLLSEDYKRALLAYDWPGNIRELENAIAYGLHMEELQQLTVNSLPEAIKERTATKPPLSLKNHERAFLLDKIALYGNTLEAKKRVAQELNISLRTLYRKLEL